MKKPKHPRYKTKEIRIKKKRIENLLYDGYCSLNDIVKICKEEKINPKNFLVPGQCIFDFWGSGKSWAITTMTNKTAEQYRKEVEKFDRENEKYIEYLEEQKKEKSVKDMKKQVKEYKSYIKNLERKIKAEELRSNPIVS